MSKEKQENPQGDDGARKNDGISEIIVSPIAAYAHGVKFHDDKGVEGEVNIPDVLLDQLSNGNGGVVHSTDGLLLKHVVLRIKQNGNGSPEVLAIRNLTAEQTAKIQARIGFGDKPKKPRKRWGDGWF